MPKKKLPQTIEECNAELGSVKYFSQNGLQGLA